MAEAVAGEKSGKVVIRNVGLMLSGDIDRPILDADTVVVVDGLIVAIGKQKDCDIDGAQTTVDARGTCLCPGLIDSHVHSVTGRRVRTSWAGSIRR
jgi:enamidase